MEAWDDVRRLLEIDEASGVIVEELVREAMAGLGVSDISDRSLSVNWRKREAMAISYGRAKVLNVEPRGGSYEVWICMPEDEVSGIEPRRFIKQEAIDTYKPAVLIHLCTGETPRLTDGELESWRRGMQHVRRIARGKGNPHHGHRNSLIGPWLRGYLSHTPTEPRFTARGTLERFGKSQWNVLVRNSEELIRFWEEHRIGTRLDWAGMDPPKATVGSMALVARCDAAGEGAEVEYEMEVRDRTNGRGVAGVDLRVIAPASDPGNPDLEPP